MRPRKREPGAPHSEGRICLHIDPQPQIHYRFLLSKTPHGFAEQLGAAIDGFLGLKNAGHGVDIVDDAAAFSMFLLVSSREMANVSVVWRCPGVIKIGLRLVSAVGET